MLEMIFQMTTYHRPVYKKIMLSEYILYFNMIEQEMQHEKHEKNSSVIFYQKYSVNLQILRCDTQAWRYAMRDKPFCSEEIRETHFKSRQLINIYNINRRKKYLISSACNL